jgi:phage baseplate assembly protein W
VTATRFPLAIDSRGRTALASADEHAADLVEAVLFTSPGERVHRPDFGAGLGALVFAPADEALAGTVELQARSALERWLAGRIDVGDVRVELGEAALRVTVTWTLTATGATGAATFERTA